jgi:hypothetical protein
MAIYINLLKAFHSLFFRPVEVPKHPKVPDFVPDYVHPEELNDLLDEHSTVIDDAISDPQKLDNVRSHFEACLLKNHRDLA